MAMNVGTKRGVRPEINMTPLVDVALVLLILFMVLTPLSLKELPIEVPKQLEVAETAAPNQIVVAMGADGTLRVDEQPVAESALAALIAARLQARQDKVVFFQIDDAANYGDAVRIIDRVRGAGAKTLGIVAGGRS